MNKVLWVIVGVIVVMVGAVFAVLIATGAVRLAGSNVEEVFCKDAAGKIVMCEDLP